MINFKELSDQSGITTCLEFDPALLVPEEGIRALCFENKCDSFGKNYTCPPFAGSLEDIKDKLSKFRHGLLLQYSKEIDVRNNKEGVIQTKIDFHHRILQMESLLAEKGITMTWSMIGGNCGLCPVCNAVSNEPCLYPEKARVSLESIAINVLDLLDKFGLDNRFHPDKITWTGCILFNR